eukprot:GHUV01042604.1.p2 GENE.GHUV01042604.1~~GHUV01042604.1.p2  ORF type:complete len:125 (+),score=2.00 GHUV01042604.1:709-1083(+)
MYCCVALAHVARTCCPTKVQVAEHAGALVDRPGISSVEGSSACLPGAKLCICSQGHAGQSNQEGYMRGERHAGEVKHTPGQDDENTLADPARKVQLQARNGRCSRRIAVRYLKGGASSMCELDV